MKIVTVNGICFLGELRVEEGKVIIDKSMEIENTNITEEDITDYLEAEHLGNLKERSFGGSGVTYGEEDLDDEMQFQLEVQKTTLEFAKKTAQGEMVIENFKSRLGKE